MEYVRKVLIAAAALGMGTGLSGCVGGLGYGDVGYASDYAYGSPGYGYGSPAYGYGTGYYGSGLGGWYNDFYYPGTGVYVCDRTGRRSRWNDGQRRYWQGRGRPGGTWTGQGRPGGTWAGQNRPGGSWNGQNRPGGWNGRPQRPDGGFQRPQQPNGGFQRPQGAQPAPGGRPGLGSWRGWQGDRGSSMQQRGPDGGGRSWGGRAGGGRGPGGPGRPQQ